MKDQDYFNMTHKELIAKGKKWLKNTFHCSVVISELKAYTRYGEIPDIIGWVNNRSILIEVKISYADFKADAGKLFRRYPEFGMGHWRFFLAPKGIIPVKSLPPKWGLYELRGERIYYAGGFKYNNAGIPLFSSDKESETALLLSYITRRNT